MSSDPEKSIWIRFSPTELTALKRTVALASMTPSFAAEAVNASRRFRENSEPCTPGEAAEFGSVLTVAAQTLLAKLDQFCDPEMHDETYIARARLKEEECCIEIDESAIVSKDEAGAYVMAWIYIPDEPGGDQAAA